MSKAIPFDGFTAGLARAACGAHQTLSHPCFFFRPSSHPQVYSRINVSGEESQPQFVNSAAFLCKASLYPPDHSCMCTCFEAKTLEMRPRRQVW